MALRVRRRQSVLEQLESRKGLNRGWAITQSSGFGGFGFGLTFLCLVFSLEDPASW